MKQRLSQMDEAQRQRLRHILFALAGSLVHTVICLLYYWFDYFRADIFTVIGLFGLIWLGNMAFVWMVLSGLNRHFKHPDMIVPLLLWVATGIVASAYYVEVFRLSVMILFFGVMLLGAFRVSFAPFIFISTYASVGYGYVLYKVVQDFPTEVTLSVEVLEWVMFTIMATSFAITGTGISGLQRKLAARNEALNQALNQIHELAIRDELTGLANRRHIMDVLHEQKMVADTGGYSFVVCYIDLDHFKSVNDRFGHGVGDEVLKTFATLMKSQIRDIDYAGRLGGEEFVLVLAKSRLEDALHVADRIRQMIQNYDFSHLSPELHMTTSIGISEYRPIEAIEELMHRADGYLYEAKQGGRNQIVTREEKKTLPEGETVIEVGDLT